MDEQVGLNRLTLCTQSSNFVVRFIVAYFKRSSIHGLCHLVKVSLTRLERSFWLTLLILSMFFCIKVSVQSVDRFNTKSTVVGLERDYHFWNTSLPSVTICPLKRLDPQLFNQYCSVYNITGTRKDELFNFLESLANSTYTNFRNIRVYNSTDAILDKLNVKPHHYAELIFNLTFDNTIKSKRDLNHLSDKVRCISENKFVYVLQVLTEYGICYTTNTFLSKEYSAHYFVNGELPPLKSLETEQFVGVQMRNYFDVGMEYNFLGFKNVAIDYFIHSPYEIMQIDRNYGYSEEISRHEMGCMEIITEDSLEHQVTVLQRKCRFQHESNLTHYPIFTKNICLSECRMNLVFQKCKCIPHFYPNRIATPKRVCSYHTLMECLPQYKELFLRFHSSDKEMEQGVSSGSIHCNCLQSCRDTIVNERAIYVIENSKDLVGANGVIIGVPESPRSRLKRQIIFTFTDLLVSIGGAAGFFLGLSVLSAVEVVYYFSFRLLWHRNGT